MRCGIPYRLGDEALHITDISLRALQPVHLRLRFHLEPQLQSGARGHWLNIFFLKLILLRPP